MNEQLFEAFEVCQAAMRTGVDLENCLSLYPDKAAELRAALEGARYAHMLAVSDVPTVPRNQSRSRLRARTAQLNDQRGIFFNLGRFPRLAFTALLVVLTLVLSWNSLLVASAKSLPGDRLYPVKRAAEKVAFTLSPLDASHHKTGSEYFHRRAEEIENLFRLGRTEKVSLEGILMEQSEGRWTVEGVPVVLADDTRILGEARPGMVVEVEGLTDPASWVQAKEVHVRYFPLAGKVDEIHPSTWIIAGNKIRLLPGAQIDPSLEVGDQALSLVYSGDDGVLSTRAIIQLSKGLIETQLRKDPSTLPAAVALDGVVTAMEVGVWMIGDQALSISAQTEIKGQVSTGDHVIVSAWRFSDGTLTARQVELAQASAGEYGQEGEIPAQDLGQRRLRQDEGTSGAAIDEVGSDDEDGGQVIESGDAELESLIHEAEDQLDSSAVGGNSQETSISEDDGDNSDKSGNPTSDDHEEHQSDGEDETGD